MPGDVVIAGAVSAIVGSVTGWLRHRQQMRRDVEVARIGREAAEAEVDRLRERIRDLEAAQLDALAQIAELRASLAQLRGS